MPEKQIPARYAGVCRRCGKKINVGDQIMWAAGAGARHVKCPDVAPVNQSGCENPSRTSPVAVAPVQEVLGPIPEGISTETVEIFWSDGEYLSGWMPSGSKPAEEWLEKLGLSHYVSGWGSHFEGDAAKSLVPGITIKTGGKFTVQDADNLARPGINERYAAKYRAKLANLDSRSRVFAQAASTGKPVILRRWSEECDRSVVECDVDILEEYALPNGSTRIDRSHSY